MDTRPVTPEPPSSWQLEIKEEGKYKVIMDELGIKWKKPPNGYYFDQYSDGHSLAEANSVEDIERYPWPDPADPARVTGLMQRIKQCITPNLPHSQN